MTPTPVKPIDEATTRHVKEIHEVLSSDPGRWYDLDAEDLRRLGGEGFTSVDIRNILVTVLGKKPAMSIDIAYDMKRDVTRVRLETSE